MAVKIIAKNRKAYHEYEVLEKFETGISLVGTEVKSLRAGKVNMGDGFCHITPDHKLELRDVHISVWDFGNIQNHEPTRPRTLLMHKREVLRLYAKIREKGLTLVPLTLYFKRNWIKVEIGLCRGKKLHDKRQTLKEKDAKREIDRLKKGDFQ